MAGCLPYNELSDSKKPSVTVHRPNTLHTFTTMNEKFIDQVQGHVALIANIVFNETLRFFRLKGLYSGIITARTSPSAVLNE